MNNIITISELLLFSIGLSLIINAVHICFQEGMFLEWLYKWLESVFRNKYNQSKYRNIEGLLYIAKPIYSCASCMPSIWSLPLLFILVWYKVLIIAIFAIVISTLIRDKIFE